MNAIQPDSVQCTLHLVARNMSSVTPELHSHSFTDLIVTSEIACNIASYVRCGTSLHNLLCTTLTVRLALLRAMQSLSVVVPLTSALPFSGFFRRACRLDTLNLYIYCKAATSSDYIDAYTRCYKLFYHQHPKVALPEALKELRVMCAHETLARPLKQSICSTQLRLLHTLHLEQLTIENLPLIGKSNYPSLTRLITSVNSPTSATEARTFQAILSNELAHLLHLTLLPLYRNNANSELTFHGIDFSGMHVLSTLHMNTNVFEALALPPHLTELRAVSRIADWKCWRLPTMEAHTHLSSLGIYNRTKQRRHGYRNYILSRVCCYFPNLRRLEIVLPPNFGSVFGNAIDAKQDVGFSPVVSLASHACDLDSVLKACPLLDFIDGDYFTFNDDGIWERMASDAMRHIRIGPSQAITIGPDIGASDSCLAFVPVTKQLSISNVAQLTTILQNTNALQHVSILDTASTLLHADEFALLTSVRLPALTSLDILIAAHSPTTIFDFKPLAGLASLAFRVARDDFRAPHPMSQWLTFLRDVVYSVPSSLTCLSASFVSACDVNVNNVHFAAEVRDASIDLPQLLQRLPHLRELSLGKGCSVIGFDDPGQDALTHRHLQEVKLCTWRGGLQHPFTGATLEALRHNVRRSAAALPSLNTFKVQFVQPCWLGDPPTYECCPLFPRLDAFAALRDEYDYAWSEHPTSTCPANSRCLTLCYAKADCLEEAGT